MAFPRVKLKSKGYSAPLLCLLKNKQEDPLRSYSLVSAIVCLFFLIIVLRENV